MKKKDLDNDYFPDSEFQSETDSNYYDYYSDDDTIIGRRQ